MQYALAQTAIQAGDARTALDLLQPVHRRVVEGDANRWHDFAARAHTLLGDLTRAEEMANVSWLKIEQDQRHWAGAVAETCYRMAVSLAKRGRHDDARVWRDRYDRAKGHRLRRLRWQLFFWGLIRP